MGKRILSDRKAEVILAASASEALSILQEQRPDVIVSDIGMPDADGYEFIRKVDSFPLTPVATPPRQLSPHSPGQKTVARPWAATAINPISSSQWSQQSL